MKNFSERCEALVQHKIGELRFQDDSDGRGWVVWCGGEDGTGRGWQPVPGYDEEDERPDQDEIDLVLVREGVVMCTGCGQYAQKKAMIYGDHADNYSGTVWHCRECARKCNLLEEVES